MNKAFEKHGYFVVKNLFCEKELSNLSVVLREFHDSWKLANAEFYSDKAVNSAYITGKKHLDNAKRNIIFNFIGSAKLMNIVYDVIPDRPSFMNTQLFFDPAKNSQKNYWHRDPQYHLSIEEQKEALLGPKVVHFRIPLVEEPGIELVPDTHKRWDTSEELEVRFETNNRKKHDALSTGVVVKLKAGDLLVFSANMIHRGLYGGDRLALDILFCDPDRDLLSFAKDDCLPTQSTIENLEDGRAFLNTKTLKAEQ